MSSRLGTIVIGGGSGFVGTALSKSLKTKGYDVLVISRKPRPNSISWSTLLHSGLPKSCTAVFSLAGQNLFYPPRFWTAGFQQNVRASRVNTTSYLADVIAKAPERPKVFVSMSGVGYYPSGQDSVFNEESEGGDFDFMSRLCTDWEAAAQLPKECNVRTVQIRSGVVLGRDGGMAKQLIIPFFMGLGGPFGSGEQPMPWIHIEDLVGLLEHALHCEAVSGAVNGVAPQIITNKEFVKAFASAMWRPALIPVPVFVLNLLYSKDRARMMSEGPKVWPEKALKTNYEFIYPNIEIACEQIHNVFM